MIENIIHFDDEYASVEKVLHWIRDNHCPELSNNIFNFRLMSYSVSSCKEDFEQNEGALYLKRYPLSNPLWRDIDGMKLTATGCIYDERIDEDIEFEYLAYIDGRYYRIDI